MKIITFIFLLIALISSVYANSNIEFKIDVNNITYLKTLDFSQDNIFQAQVKLPILNSKIQLIRVSSNDLPKEFFNYNYTIDSSTITINISLEYKDPLFSNIDYILLPYSIVKFYLENGTQEDLSLIFTNLHHYKREDVLRQVVNSYQNKLTSKIKSIILAYTISISSDFSHQRSVDYLNYLQTSNLYDDDEITLLKAIIGLTSASETIAFKKKIVGSLLQTTQMINQLHPGNETVSYFLK